MSAPEKHNLTLKMAEMGFVEMDDAGPGLTAWCGHGIRLDLPASMQSSAPAILSLIQARIIDQARSQGRNQVRTQIRAALDI